MRRQSLFSPLAKLFKLQAISLFENKSCTDSFAPLQIGNSNDGALRDSGVFAQRFLDLQRGYFMPACLQDVDVGTPEDAVDAVFKHRCISRSEPPITKSFPCRLRFTPVFEEDVFATNLNLTGNSRLDRLA